MITIIVTALILLTSPWHDGSAVPEVLRGRPSEVAASTGEAESSIDACQELEDRYREASADEERSDVDALKQARDEACGVAAGGFLFRNFRLMMVILIAEIVLEMGLVFYVIAQLRKIDEVRIQSEDSRKKIEWLIVNKKLIAE